MFSSILSSAYRFVVLVGILTNVVYYASINGRLNSIEARLNSMDARLNSFEARIDTRFNSIDDRFNRLEVKLTP